MSGSLRARETFPTALSPALPHPTMRPLTLLRLRLRTSSSPFRLRLLTTPAAPAKPASRMSAYLTQLRQRYPSAEPASLIASFLILHELTAVVPLALGFLGLRWAGVGDGMMDWILDEADAPAPTTGQGDALALAGPEGGLTGWARGRLKDWVVRGEEQAQRVGRRYGVMGYTKETVDEREGRRAAEKDERERGVVRPREPYAVGRDVANFLVAYIAVKVSRTPADRACRVAREQEAEVGLAMNATCVERAGSRPAQDLALGTNGPAHGQLTRVEDQGAQEYWGARACEEAVGGPLGRWRSP